jgi:starch phosphorylase
MAIYKKLKRGELPKWNPTCFIFGAKSAPGYARAKAIIKYINELANLVNNDPDTKDKLQVVYCSNYNVSYAEKIVTAADISEQTSTAGTEASGTGNMKFMMNGAITCGTMDGANVEIHDLVGSDNIVIFGLRANEVNEIYAKHDYNPREIYENDPRIKQIIDQLTNGFFEYVDSNEFVEIRENLLNKDQYLVLKDFDSYVKAQETINDFYKDQDRWLESSIINTAKSGFFTTDRTMRQYNEDIWHVEPIIIK